MFVVFPATLVLLVTVPRAFYLLDRDRQLSWRRIGWPLAFGAASLLAVLVMLANEVAYGMGNTDFLSSIF